MPCRREDGRTSRRTRDVSKKPIFRWTVGPAGATGRVGPGSPRRGVIMVTGTGVFVLRDEATLVPMAAASFATEDDFQRLLASFPELLAGDQIDTEVPRRFMLVAREQGIADGEGGGARWSLDHLFLDQDGIPTLVEVKRGTDTRIRREVVGQMLDYAANSILHWPVEELRARFGSRCGEEGRDPEAVLAELIGPGRNGEGFWSQVRTNLQAGRVRLLFVADRVPPELRRVVEFLNRQMQPAAMPGRGEPGTRRACWPRSPPGRPISRTWWRSPARSSSGRCAMPTPSSTTTTRAGAR